MLQITAKFNGEPSFFYMDYSGEVPSKICTPENPAVKSLDILLQHKNKKLDTWQ